VIAYENDFEFNEQVRSKVTNMSVNNNKTYLIDCTLQGDGR
jgi:hypothetical protein